MDMIPMQGGLKVFSTKLVKLPPEEGELFSWPSFLVGVVVE